MKRLLCIVFALLLLAGCSGEVQETNPVETTVPTEPPKPWTEELGMPWDKEGVLLEVPLTIPDGLHYSSMLGFDGDLLLWSVDDHLEGSSTLELCLVELDDGTVTASKEYSFGTTVMPQVLGDRIYLCDSSTGTILMLDDSLNSVETWSAQPCEGTWFMGAGETLYLYDWENGLTLQNLSGGEVPALPVAGDLVNNFYASGSHATMEYYDANTGEPRLAIVNLLSGEVSVPPFDLQCDIVYLYENNWLFGKYEDSHVYYLGSGDELRTVHTGQDMLSVLPEGYILRSSEETGWQTLYDMDGSAIAGCRVSELPYTYSVFEWIWNPALDGYFLTVGNYGGDQRLLFWDISHGNAGEALALEPLPDVSEQEAAVRERVRALEERYGVSISVGTECDTVFDEFYATQCTDWDKVNEALDTLDRAFSAYPEGFFRQLRYGDVRGIRIQLISDLQADGSGRYGGGYNAFTQERWDHNLVVMDIDDSYVMTYYHEITHIIDNRLTWDYRTRMEALFSETAWAELNPDWFTGYSYDYSMEHNLWDAESFVDGYATISPTEDRARIMEYAMSSDCEWMFEDSEILLEKLDYYCRCIRDTFDTEGWPEELIWEQYLSLKD